MHDLGDGKARFQGQDDQGQPFELALALHDFFDWWDSLATKLDKADPRAGLRAVQEFVRRQFSVSLNLSQCDELVNAAHYELERLGKERAQRLASLHASGLPS
jgi:hypothetical protein